MGQGGSSTEVAEVYEHWLYLICICTTSGLRASVTHLRLCQCLTFPPAAAAALIISGTERGWIVGIRQPHSPSICLRGRNKFHRDLIIWPHVHDRALSMFILNCFPWSLRRSAQPVTVLSLSFACQPLCPQFMFPFHLLARLILSSSPPSSASQVLFLPLCI